EVEDILNADTVAENANVICEQPIHSESHEEILTVTRNETICESFMPQEPVTVTIKSSYTQTDEQFVNQWPKKNKMTQTCKLPATVTSNKTKTTSKKTQTYLTNECLLQYIAAAKPKVLVCSSTQTALIENELVPNTSQPELDSDPIDKHSSSDEEYQSDESDLESDEGINGDRGELITLSSNKLPHDQMKFIVFEQSIVKRFGVCSTCRSTCTVSLQRNIGTYCKIALHCSADSSHSFTWSTGPLRNRLPVLHLMIASSVLCTGMECAKALRLFDFLKIMCFKRREFSNLLTGYVIPAVFNVWKRQQQCLLNSIKDNPICIASDMRVDSPGHSGLFGSGSSLDVDRNIILDTQVIKSTEVKNSNAMELESLKRQTAYLEQSDVNVKKLVTDRHSQVSSYLAQEKPDIEHAYDVWHVAKGEKKRLLKVVKIKKFRKLKPWIGSIINLMYWVAISSQSPVEREEKWLSLLNHIVDVHVHNENKLFMKCTHETIERQWLQTGSAIYKKLIEIITRPRLLTAIRKLSNYHQTSGLEAKHSLDNTFASKNVYYPYHSLMARLFCSNLHYNENANRSQATTAEGVSRWSIVYPKANKGEKAVAKPLKEQPTYKYIQTIQEECLKLRNDFSTLKKAISHSKELLPEEPVTLVEKYLDGKQPKPKSDIVAAKHSRFTQPALPGVDEDHCDCSGKCATRRCKCKNELRKCKSACGCKKEACKNV
ncbi:Hypothetical predicted protein, partial [Paramuricea clavata]